MPARRFADRAPMDSRSYREQSQRPRYRRDEPRFQSDLDRDFAAMKRVWQMIRAGAVRMVGEVGRQY
ncbi:MAG: hypothetical protein CMN91_01120 [Synechococcus sp. ARS1019]|nr:hypothetical protein [Synechococcus sp. ARS1019]